MQIRKYKTQDLPYMQTIWNEVVKAGVAFPQENMLSLEQATEFFAQQTYCAVALDTPGTADILGLYILHPNNVGRCSHIANASFAVRSCLRGKHIGKSLVSDCLLQAKKHGFMIMQFNAVVQENTPARHLYESLGFVQLGTIPQGFRLKDGSFANICPYYKTL